MEFLDVGHTDLGLPYLSSSSILSTQEPRDDAQETGVLVNPEGSLIGKMFSFNSHRQADQYILSEEQFQQHTTACARSVCRVVAQYELDSSFQCGEEQCSKSGIKFCKKCQKLACHDCADCLHTEGHQLVMISKLLQTFPREIHFTGTAFRVSKNKLVTAMHVVKQQLKLDHPLVNFSCNYKLKKVFLIHSIKGAFAHFNLESEAQIPGSNVYEASLTPRTSHPLPEETWKYNEIAWNTPYDFAFLECNNLPSVQRMPISIPCVRESFMAAVLRFPNFVESDKFITDYCPGTASEEHCKRLYHLIRGKLCNFEHLVLSFGEAMVTVGTSSALQAHGCPTMSGEAGGLLFPMEHTNCCLFAGIHLGGDKSMFNNVFVSARQGSFAIEYCEKVLNDLDSETLQEFKTNKELAAEMIEYYSKLVSLINGEELLQKLAQ